MLQRVMSRFCVEIFLSHRPKVFVGESLVLHYFRVSKDVRNKRREIHDFPSKTFCLTVKKNFVG